MYSSNGKVMSSRCRMLHLHYLTDGRSEDGETLLQIGIGNRQRRNQLEYPAARAAGTDQQAVVETLRAHLLRQRAVAQIDRLQHALAAHLESAAGMLAADFSEVFAHPPALAPYLAHQLVVVEVLQRLDAGDEGQALAAEGAG